jgi:ComF family protein
MFHLDPGNPLAEGFWGRVWLEQAVAWFYFRKGSIYQEVLHRMKYNYRPDIGIFLGKEFGYELNRSPMFIKPDLIIPVPLHKRKQRLRGYNQSELIAKGLSLAMKLPIETRALQKSQSTSTQTRKSRFDRWINVSGMFEVVMPELIAGRHVLLVDDVVTTGATLEACAEVLLKVGGVKVSVAAIAWAND